MPLPSPSALPRLRAWFTSRGWTPSAFQEETWAAYARGESGLVHVPTGAGKTLAATIGPLADLAERGGQLLYVSPLRAMSRDLEKALTQPAAELGLRVETRTGDTASHVRQRQKRRPPDVLITTPESLALLLSEPDAPDRFAPLRAVVIDEWHELIDSKRGSLLELCLARLRTFAPGLRTWALSATLGNPEEAARAAVGVGIEPTVVRAAMDRPVIVETLLPDRPDQLPWAGHLGTEMAPRLLEWLDPALPTLVFCNTRAQAERWFQEILRRRPQWAAVIGLHHGSVDREDRQSLEDALKEGEARIAVCTASLDLGVDLSPIERVVQIGSPKGIARLLQRAGRASHRPGEPCRILCVPTHALQLVEIAAARDALARGAVEPRLPLSRPLDVLAQHLVTCALGGGFTPEAMRAEVRRAWSYRQLTDAEFDQALALVREGGKSLRAYAQYRKVVEVDGRHVVPDADLARAHRAAIGTITSETAMTVRWVSGGTLGTIEESFVGRLSPGDTFVFAGRALELVALRDMAALVRPAKKKTLRTPHWGGTKLPISGSLGAAVREMFHRVSTDAPVDAPELTCAAPLLTEQARLSHVPRADELLVEEVATEEGHHLFVYPFEGRAVHEGLAVLLAVRWCRLRRAHLEISVNDYGVELLADAPFPWADALAADPFSTARLAEDVLESLNVTELARRRFRDVARIAGLVHPGAPHQRKTMRQVQTSAGLLYDVFCRYDPENVLLGQARREVLEQSFDHDRLYTSLERLQGARLVHTRPAHPTPLGWPLVLERLAVDAAGNESAAERVARWRAEWTST